MSRTLPPSKAACRAEFEPRVEDADPDAPFYEDQLSGFNGALAVNLPIQGSCAEVMMLALARLHAVLRDQPATLIATVHDEAVFLVPNDMQVAVAIADIARKEMVAAFLDVFPNAPTLNLVEPKIGSNWGDLHSFAESGLRRSDPIQLCTVCTAQRLGRLGRPSGRCRSRGADRTPPTTT